jgi:hypothetical protein
MGCHGGLPREKEYASKIRLNADEAFEIERPPSLRELGYSLRKLPSIIPKGGTTLRITAWWICTATRREAHSAIR